LGAVNVLVHKATLGVLQWAWDGVSYETFQGVRCPRLEAVTLETYGLDSADWWQIPNGTPLARQIALCYPFFDPVVTEGELVGVQPWPAWRRYGEEEPEQDQPVKPRRRGKYNRRRRGELGAHA
jgi:hypothetical protein